MRKGSDGIETLSSIMTKFNKLQIFQSVLQFGGEDKSRDGGGMRVNIGFGQAQSTSKYDLINGKRLRVPTLFKDGEQYLNGLEDGCKQVLGLVVQHFSKILKSKYVGMNNKKEHRLSKNTLSINIEKAMTSFLST